MTTDPNSTPTREPVFTPRQLRYLIWIGVTILLGVAVRYGVWPPAGTVVIPPPAPEFTQAPAGTADTAVSLTSPELVRAGAKSVTVTFPAKPGTPDPAPPPRPAPSRVRTVDQIRAAVGTVQIGQGMCSAQLVDLSHEGESDWCLPDGSGLIACAAHCCTAVGQSAVFRLPDGRTFDAVCVALDRDADAMWLRTKGRVPGNLPTVVLADKSPSPGTECWHCGHGWDQPRNIERGKVTGAPLRDGKLPLYIDLSQGDSGGGFFRCDNNELFSTACCTTAIARIADAFGPSTEALRKLLPVAKASKVRQGGVRLCEPAPHPKEMPPGK